MPEMSWPLCTGPKRVRRVLGTTSGALGLPTWLAEAVRKLSKKAGWGKLAPRKKKSLKPRRDRTHVISRLGKALYRSPKQVLPTTTYC